MKPFDDSEVPDVRQRLLADREFLDFLARYKMPLLFRVLPGLTRKLVQWFLRREMRDVVDIASFQQVISVYAKRLVQHTMTSFSFEGVDKLEPGRGYLFVGNHRDIAFDSMLVDYALFLSGRPTVRIAVGDNLIQKPFATDLMRLNKSFFISRGESNPKKLYAALRESSEYIHESVEAGESIWIAQAEGRAKDGIDKSDPAIVKMLSLAKRKQPFKDVIGQLNITPVSVAYEYDPCDLLKARELRQLEEHGSYEKSEGEDLLSLVKGLAEFKGRVILIFGETLSDEYETPEEVAIELDRQILQHYTLFPCNLHALFLHDPALYAEITDSVTNQHHDEEFSRRLLNCPAADRSKLTQMYANPVIHQHKLGIKPVVYS